MTAATHSDAPACGQAHRRTPTHTKRPLVCLYLGLRRHDHSPTIALALALAAAFRILKLLLPPPQVPDAHADDINTVAWADREYRPNLLLSGSDDHLIKGGSRC